MTLDDHRRIGRRTLLRASLAGTLLMPITAALQAFSRILSQIKEVRNVVSLTADVHYTAAISYHPDQASFTDFSPFWEFVSGPLNAGAFPQSPLDGAFGARYEFVHAPTEKNTSPAEGYQHFGAVRVDSDTRALTVDLCDASGKSLYAKELLPA